MKWLILAAALLFSGASPASSDADKAFRDFERGDYRLALKAWTVLANRGDAEGQYFLGHMYAEGLGAPQDYARAALWYGQAISHMGLGVVPPNATTFLVHKANVVVSHFDSVAKTWKLIREVIKDMQKSDDKIRRYPPINSHPYRGEE